MSQVPTNTLEDAELFKQTHLPDDWTKEIEEAKALKEQADRAREKLGEQLYDEAKND